MTITARPFLMFEGQAEEAITHYIDVLGGEVLSMTRHPAELPPEQAAAIAEAKAAGIEMGLNDVAGKIQLAEVRLADLRIYVSDSLAQHPFTFTPSVSIYVEFDDKDEVTRVANALDAGEQQFMPLSDDYGFSPRFAWVQDTWGVTWQIAARPGAA